MQKQNCVNGLVESLSCQAWGSNFNRQIERREHLWDQWSVISWLGILIYFLFKIQHMSSVLVWEMLEFGCTLLLNEFVWYLGYCQFLTSCSSSHWCTGRTPAMSQRFSIGLMMKDLFIVNIYVLGANVCSKSLNNLMELWLLFSRGRSLLWYCILISNMQ